MLPMIAATKTGDCACTEQCYALARKVPSVEGCNVRLNSYLYQLGIEIVKQVEATFKDMPQITMMELSMHIYKAMMKCELTADLNAGSEA